MTCSIYCDSGRQPCPTPRNCGDGCHFNNATLHSTPLITDNSDLTDPAEPPSKTGRLFIWAVGLVAACLAIVHLVPK